MLAAPHEEGVGLAVIERRLRVADSGAAKHPLWSSFEAVGVGECEGMRICCQLVRAAAAREYVHGVEARIEDGAVIGEARSGARRRDLDPARRSESVRRSQHPGVSE